MIEQGIPEGALLTPEQAVARLLTLTPEQQVEAMRRLLDSADRATKCLMEDHAGAMQFARSHRCTDTEKAFQDGANHALNQIIKTLDEQTA